MQSDSEQSRYEKQREKELAHVARQREKLRRKARRRHTVFRRLRLGRKPSVDLPSQIAPED